MIIWLTHWTHLQIKTLYHSLGILISICLILLDIAFDFSHLKRIYRKHHILALFNLQNDATGAVTVFVIEVWAVDYQYLWKVSETRYQYFFTLFLMNANIRVWLITRTMRRRLASSWETVHRPHAKNLHTNCRCCRWRTGWDHIANLLNFKFSSSSLQISYFICHFF